jgi:hypothetical protein
MPHCFAVRRVGDQGVCPCRLDQSVHGRERLHDSGARSTLVQMLGQALAVKEGQLAQQQALQNRAVRAGHNQIHRFLPGESVKQAGQHQA